jgi:hypothetical protein
LEVLAAGARWADHRRKPEDIDARLATLTTLAKAGQASWCSGEDWIQGGA